MCGGEMVRIYCMRQESIFISFFLKGMVDLHKIMENLTKYLNIELYIVNILCHLLLVEIQFQSIAMESIYYMINFSTLVPKTTFQQAQWII